MVLKWSPEMATGIHQVDLQHQELIEMLNALEAARTGGRTGQAVAEVLPRLTAYVMFHFATEEGMMTALDDEDGHVAAHMGEHREFARRVQQLTGTPLAPEELAGFVAYLKDWLTGHIMQADRQLGALVRESGLPQR